MKSDEDRKTKQIEILYERLEAITVAAKLERLHDQRVWKELIESCDKALKEVGENR